MSPTHASWKEEVTARGLGHQREPQRELFITTPPPPSGSQDGAHSADSKSKNVGKFIYFFKTFLICNVLSKNVLADQALAIFSHSI